jgi:hypothetical protein
MKCGVHDTVSLQLAGYKPSRPIVSSVVVGGWHSEFDQKYGTSVSLGKGGHQA